MGKIQLKKIGKNFTMLNTISMKSKDIRIEFDYKINDLNESKRDIAFESKYHHETLYLI